jgi:16S rRNA G966 N2-methylase RsmD
MTKLSKPKGSQGLLLKRCSELKPYANNARTHSKEQITKIANSIKTFGFTNPILIDGDNNIIAGHGRLLAAQQLGVDEVPAIDLSHLTKDEARAYVIADNRLALDAGWDNDLLKLELSELNDLGFDLDVIGFSADELDSILNDHSIEDGLTDDDSIPVDVETRCKLGDVWLLGDHRLMCGDSTAITDVDKLLNAIKVDMVFTDPPYGIGFAYDQYDDVKGAAYEEFITQVWHILKSLNCKVVLTPGNMNVRLWLKLDDFKFGCWVKKNAMCGSSIAHLNLFEILLCYGVDRNRASDLFEYNVRQQEGTGNHPCPKLLEYVLDILKSWSDPKNTILDLFGGSGSTLIACEKSKRKCFMMELSPHYCDVILKRWEDFTGKIATLEVSNG